MSEDIFLVACRDKFRFRHKGFQGELNTEDLFGLSLTQLDEIAIGLNKQVKEASEESFIKPKTTMSKTLSMKLSVVLNVIDLKQEEQKAKQDKQKLKAEYDAILAHADKLNKQRLEDKYTTPEEALKRLEELKGLLQEEP